MPPKPTDLRPPFTLETALAKVRAAEDAWNSRDPDRVALAYTEDYARARVPMLPVVAGPQETCRQILLYSILLAPIGASPWFLGYSGAAYGGTALIAGALMVAFAWRLRGERDEERAAGAAKRLFAFSILYLFTLFAVLLIEGVLLGRATV